jgi:hypothetical protein
VAQTLVCMSAPRLEEQGAQRGKAATKRDPSPRLPSPSSFSPEGGGKRGRGVGVRGLF